MSSIFRRPAACTPTITSYLEPIDHVGDGGIHVPDPEYIARREAAYLANSDYDSTGSAADAGTPSRPDTGVFLSPDDASSVYSNDDAKVMSSHYFSAESDVSYTDPVEELSHFMLNNAAQDYDISDLQQKFGMSSAPAAMQDAPHGEIAGFAPQVEGSVYGKGKVDSARDRTSSKPPSGSTEGKGAENPDAVPTAGGIKLGAKAKKWGDWRDRMLKQAEEAGLLTEEFLQAAEEAEQAEDSAEAEELPKSKSTSSLLKKLKSIAGRKRSSAK